jgi:hypothetical protein
VLREADIGSDCARRIEALSNLANLVHQAYLWFEMQEQPPPASQLQAWMRKIDAALAQLLVVQSRVRRRYTGESVNVGAWTSKTGERPV